tara:strand:+ start:27 stop:797 length:771 start_codon:yes stop_codon:yes gene_type:complete
MNYLKIIKEIKTNGYYICNNFYKKKDLNKIKNSLLNTLNYIKKSKQKDLQKKYYEIKKYNRKLKGNWYDMANYNLTLFEFVHNKKIIELVKKYFKTKVIFSSRPCIHVHDDTNKHILLPHQETNMFSVDGILLWVPLFDTNKDTGGLTIYKKSHKRGFFKHTTKDPSGKKRWTNNYTNIHPSIYNNFKKVNLEVKSGSAVLMINSLIHCGYPNKTKKHVRITVTERFNPLHKIPYLKKTNVPIKIPYTANYNSIKD